MLSHKERWPLKRVLKSQPTLLRHCLQLYACVLKHVGHWSHRRCSNNSLEHRAISSFFAHFDLDLNHNLAPDRLSRKHGAWGGKAHRLTYYYLVRGYDANLITYTKSPSNTAQYWPLLIQTRCMKNFNKVKPYLPSCMGPSLVRVWHLLGLYSIVNFSMFALNDFGYICMPN